IENRAQNRRVDIVILTKELTMTEPTSQLYKDNGSNPGATVAATTTEEPVLSPVQPPEDTVLSQ
ncbi:MAG: hypothetical protein KKA42_13420, partial [candidate division Zixibacteria bacterium]|nr:hypothetical protein [candidate division Zixibacteria bacterium]